MLRPLALDAVQERADMARVAEDELKEIANHLYREGLVDGLSVYDVLSTPCLRDAVFNHKAWGALCRTANGKVYDVYRELVGAHVRCEEFGVIVSRPALGTKQPGVTLLSGEEASLPSGLEFRRYMAPSDVEQRMWCKFNEMSATFWFDCMYVLFFLADSPVGTGHQLSTPLLMLLVDTTRYLSCSTKATRLSGRPCTVTRERCVW
jgi:hypothetical protein